MSIRFRELVSSIEFKAAISTVGLSALNSTFWFYQSRNSFSLECLQLPILTAVVLLAQRAFSELAQQMGFEDQERKSLSGFLGAVVCLSFSPFHLGDSIVKSPNPLDIVLSGCSVSGILLVDSYFLKDRGFARPWTSNWAFLNTPYGFLRRSFTNLSGTHNS